MSDQVNLTVQPPMPDLTGRVHALERGMEGLSVSITKQGENFAAALGKQGDVMFAKFDALSSKMEARSQTPWPTIISFGGLLLSFTMAVGALAYWPITAGIAETKAGLKEMSAGIVTRTEHVEHWKSIDESIQRVRERVARSDADRDKDYDRIERRLERLETTKR